MRWDPAATVKSWPVTITVYDKEWTIPAVPASEWVAAYLTGGYDGILELLPDEAQAAIADAVLDTIDTGEIEDTDDAVRDAIEAATGVSPWWVAERLMVMSAEPEGWAGHLLVRGFDYSRVSIGGLCAAVWHLVQQIPDEKRGPLVAAIEEPPEGIETEPGEVDASWFTGD